MTVLAAQSIRARNLVLPTQERYKFQGVSGGLGFCGYDIALLKTVWLIPLVRSFVVTDSLEYFNMQDDVVGIVHDKSTWARSGICVQNTVIEPGWRGILAIELTLHSLRPRRIEAGTPIAQVVFHKLDQPTEKPYHGKYQDQKAGTKAIFEKPPQQELYEDAPRITPGPYSDDPGPTAVIGIS